MGNKFPNKLAKRHAKVGGCSWNNLVAIEKDMTIKCSNQESILEITTPKVSNRRERVELCIPVEDKGEGWEALAGGMINMLGVEKFLQPQRDTQPSMIVLLSESLKKRDLRKEKGQAS